MKRGRGMCGTFKVNSLTYHAHTTFIDINRPCSGMYTYLWTDLGTCTHHRVIYMLTLHARTNVPLSSAWLPTFFQQPLFWWCQIWVGLVLVLVYFQFIFTKNCKFFQNMKTWPATATRITTPCVRTCLASFGEPTTAKVRDEFTEPA